LSRHQRPEKIACVATLAQVLRQMKKSQKKNREKFNELKFLRQNHGLRQRVATHAIFAARWRGDNFKKSHHHCKQKIARVAAALL